MSSRVPFVGGNWKMNTTAASASALAFAVAEGVQRESLGARCEVAVFPPFPYLDHCRKALGSSGVLLGAQDVYFEPDGAFTGEISVSMLKDLGVSVVLIGHSERRHVLGETDEVVNRKVKAALAGGLRVILCVGEKLEQRERGETDRVNIHQCMAGLRGVDPAHAQHITIAYEPVWAIGTGKTATPADAQDAQMKIRRCLSDIFGGVAAGGIRIQYGGSMKASNAPELMAQHDVDGGLIGGASLKADEFLSIIRSAATARKV